MAELTTPVRGVLAATDTPLSGVGQIGYGIVVGSTGANEDWLVAGGTQGGIWTLTAPANTWARRGDLDTAGEFANMPSVRVREGNQGVAGSVFYYDGPAAPALGSTSLTWTLGAFGRPALDGAGLDLNHPYLELPFQGVPASEVGYGPLRIQLSDRGIVTSIAGGVGMETYIEGLVPSWVSGGGIPTFSAGEAWVPGQNDVLEIPADGTNGPTVSPPLADFVYFYLQPSVSGTNIWGNTTAPASPYLGTARTMSGNTSERYVCALRTNSGGTAFYNFQAQRLGDKALLVSYLEDTTASPFRVVSGSAAQTETTVNLGSSGSKLVPPTCRMALLRVLTNASAAVGLGNSEDSVTGGSGNPGIRNVTTSADKDVWMPLDSSQSFTFWNRAASGSVNIDVLGYVDRR
jgi:hypothetical protein